MKSDRVPWLIAGLTVLLAALHEFILLALDKHISFRSQLIFWIGILFGLSFLYFTSKYLAKYFQRQKQVLNQLEIAEKSVEDAYQRLDAIFKVNEMFIEADDENEIVDRVLSLIVDLVQVRGASYIPIDEHGQPQALLSRGEFPEGVQEALKEKLILADVKTNCRKCELRGQLNTSRECPLLQELDSQLYSVICMPIRWGGHEFGVLNLIMGEKNSLDQRTTEFLKALVDEIAIGMESIRIRRRELKALQQLHYLRHKTDLTNLLQDLLENANQTLDSDFTLLTVPAHFNFGSELNVKAGSFPNQSRSFLDGVIQGVISSSEPMILGEVSMGGMVDPGVKSIIAVPLTAGERNIGAILIGSQRNRAFHQRQLAGLQMVASQVAIVIQNSHLMDELEYRTMMRERKLLAREIHDGLAQTLGYLKIQVSQMKNFLSRNEIDKIQHNLNLYYEALDAAYNDVRETIDGLRIEAECDLSDWLLQTVNEFEEISGLRIEMQNIELNHELPIEVHAQLIRIIQEALNNIRKHAEAKNVWIICQEDAEDLFLAVRDDGVGFSPEEVPLTSKHGLRGMQERAELIGADFQITSCPLEGTILRIRLPLKNIKESELVK